MRQPLGWKGIPSCEYFCFGKMFAAVLLLLVLFVAPWRAAYADDADDTAPTVSLMCPTAESDSFLGTSGHNLSALIKFSESVTGFPYYDTVDDPTPDGDNESSIWALVGVTPQVSHPRGVSVTQNGADVIKPGSPFFFWRNGFFHGMYIFRAAVRDDVSGRIVAQIPAGVAWDADENPNSASNRLSLSHNRTISVSDVNATEGTDATIDFEVALDVSDDCATATVDWAVSNGTATAGEDYTATSGTLTFSPGETTKTISIPLLDDSVSEGVETIHLRLSDASGATLTRNALARPLGQAMGNIISDEDTDSPSVTLSSNATAPVNGWFKVLVTFSEPVQGFEMSDLAITNGSAVRINSWDDGATYSVSVVPDAGVSGEISISVPAAVATDYANNSNAASVEFVILASTVIETGLHRPAATVRCPVGNPYESLEPGSTSIFADIGFSSPVNFSISGVSVTQNGVDVVYSASTFLGGHGQRYPYHANVQKGVSGTLLVKVLPGAGNAFELSFREETIVLASTASNVLHVAHNWTASVGNASATEGTDDTIDFEVSLNGRDDCRTVTVDWTTQDGTATAGEDYIAANGTLTFAPGETTKTVSVTVLDDAVGDSGETFTLTLSNALGVEIADAEATGTILNDKADTPPLPVVSIAATATPVTEATAAAYTLARTGSTDAELTVEVSVSENGAAVSGTAPTSVTFAAESSTATLSVATEDDEVSEDASTLTATVSSGTGYTVDETSGSAEVVIEDDDAAPVVTTASPIAVAENGTAVATLAATDEDTATVDLSWSIPAGAAGGTDGAKFALTTGGELTFRVGEGLRGAGRCGHRRRLRGHGTSDGWSQSSGCGVGGAALGRGRGSAEAVARVGGR